MAIQSRPAVWTLLDLAAHLAVRGVKSSKIKEIFLDLSFQSVFRWPLHKQEFYLKCTLNGFASNPIVLVDVDSCLAAARVRRDPDSLEYFTWLKKKGMKYIIVDGNNRMTTIRAFFNDKVGIPKGNYTINGVPFTVNGENKAVKFSELGENEQNYMKSILLTMTIVTDISRRELSEYFEALNDGVKLNDQEKRNAFFSEFAEQVRDAGKKCRETFKNKVKQLDVNRRGHDAFIAYMAVSCQSEQFSTDIKNPLVNAAYGKNIVYHTPIAENKGSWEGILDDTVKVLDFFPNKMVTTQSVVDMFNFMRQIQDMDIPDWKKFSEYLYDVIHVCLECREPDCFQDEQGTWFSYSGTLRGGAKGEYMKARLDYILKVFYKDSLAESLMIPKKEIQKEKRLFTPYQRYLIWKKQGGIDINGTEIKLSELNDTTKWQADHIVEYRKGGLTEVENGQILSAGDHLLKTSEDNRKRLNEEFEAKVQQQPSLS